MRSLLSTTALTAVLALAVPAPFMPALAQTGGAGSPGAAGSGTTGTGTGATAGAQTQGQAPANPLPMTQGQGAAGSQRPSTAAGAMGATRAQGASPSASASPSGSANPSGAALSPGMGASNMPGGAMSGSTQGMAGQGSQSMTMDEAQVRDLLRSQGYGDAQSVTRDGNAYKARVTRNGRPADITIDAYTGTIRNQAARR